MSEQELRQRVYIAGPMTGYTDYNYPAFDKASKFWADRGWAVLNPADHFLGDQGLQMATYMRGAVHAVLQADAIALLPGWAHSPGATMEVIMGHRMGLPVYDAITGEAMEIKPVRYSHAFPETP